MLQFTSLGQGLPRSAQGSGSRLPFLPNLPCAAEKANAVSSLSATRPLAMADRRLHQPQQPRHAPHPVQCLHDDEQSAALKITHNSSNGTAQAPPQSSVDLPADLQGYRPNVGMCVVNKHGLVLAATRLDDTSNTWQMPQGGIDPGEQPMDAAIRVR